MMVVIKPSGWIMAEIKADISRLDDVIGYELDFLHKESDFQLDK